MTWKYKSLGTKWTKEIGKENGAQGIVCYGCWSQALKSWHIEPDWPEYNDKGKCITCPRISVATMPRPSVTL